MILLIILACIMLDLIVSLLICNQRNQYTPIVQDIIRAGQIPSKSNLNPVTTQTSNTLQLQKGWISRMVLGFSKRPTGVIALGIIIVIGIIGLIGPSIAAQNPLDPHTPESFLPQEPSDIHPFGTDFQDKDLLSQFLWGAGSTVGFALLVLIFSAALGIFVGFVFASLGKIVDGIFVIIANFFIVVSFFLPLTLIAISGGFGSKLLTAPFPSSLSY